MLKREYSISIYGYIGLSIFNLTKDDFSTDLIYNNYFLFAMLAGGMPYFLCETISLLYSYDKYIHYRSTGAGGGLGGLYL
jgi:hypothetical protein